MEKRNVTMKDIAAHVNVSVSTVSYVLNFSEKEKISHETRLKVLQAAKDMGYLPNMSARSLASKKSNLIGIIINKPAAGQVFRKYAYYELAERLHIELRRRGYDVMLLFANELEYNVASQRSFEATFVIDADVREWARIAERFYTPVVSIDGLVENELFYKILPDYRAVIGKARGMLASESPFLVLEQRQNNGVMSIITQGFAPENICVCSDTSQLEMFLAKMHKNEGIVIGEMLGVSAERFIGNDKIVVATMSDSQGVLMPDTRTVPLGYGKLAETAAELACAVIRMDYEKFSDKVVIV